MLEKVKKLFRKRPSEEEVNQRYRSAPDEIKFDTGIDLDAAMKSTQNLSDEELAKLTMQAAGQDDDTTTE